MNWILASQSPRRQELLKLIISDFKICVSQTDEVLNPTDEPGSAVMALAYQKARAIGQISEPNDIIIGADTIVYCEGFMGKPTSTLQAKEMLEKLSGKEHAVYTGYCIYKVGSNEKIIDYVKTVVEFKHLTALEIESYISSGEPMDKAGAYGIQGYGAKFIKRIDGDYYTVMGLPVNQLYETLLRHFSSDMI